MPSLSSLAHALPREGRVGLLAECVTASWVIKYLLLCGCDALAARLLLLRNSSASSGAASLKANKLDQQHSLPHARFSYKYALTERNATNFADRKNRNKKIEPDDEFVDLDSAGWRDVPADHPEVVRLRNDLEKYNGLADLETCSPGDVQRAAELFYRDGFVVIRDVLDAKQLAKLREGCEEVMTEIVKLDKHRRGNRGSHRYSFSPAYQHDSMLHHPAWVQLVDLPTLTPILQRIFDSPDYHCLNAGGDFCLPGTTLYEPLHTDVGDRHAYKAGDVLKSHGSFRDPRGKVTLRDLPCPSIACNFFTDDQTALNGPTRQIRGTQKWCMRSPSLEEEPSWMQYSTACPVKAGSVILRDIRAWHGGTPNLSNKCRAIPAVYFWAPWYRENLGETGPAMPRDVYEDPEITSDYARHLLRYLVAKPGEHIDCSMRSDFGSF